MATKEDQDDSISFSHVIQEFQDTVCEPCSESGSLLKAEGYCVICNEFMCQPCIQYHKRMKISKNHEVLGPDEMPKTKPPFEEKKGRLSSRDMFIDECKLHNRETIEFYCKYHKSVLCAVCVTLSHKSCTDIQQVIDVFLEEDIRNDLERFPQRLNDASEELCTILQTAENNHFKVKERKEKLLSDICKHKESAIETIHKLAATLEISVEKMALENQTQLDQRIKYCKTLQRHTDILGKEFKDLQNKNQKTNEFILMNQSEHQLEILEKNICDMNANALFANYVFLPYSQRLGQLVEEAKTNTCDRCKKIDMKSSFPNRACGHNICYACLKGPFYSEAACLICGKKTVECEKCYTAVVKSTATTLACSHTVCLPCRKKQIEEEAPCNCRNCGQITGNQPDGSVKTIKEGPLLKVKFIFPDGIQECYHPRPGKKYKGRTLTGYLTNDGQGKEMLEKLMTAFNRKLICKIEDDTVTPNVELWKADDVDIREGFSRYCERLTERLKKLRIIGRRLFTPYLY